MIRRILLVFALCLLPTLVQAQALVAPCTSRASTLGNIAGCTPVSTINPFPVTGTFAVTITSATINIPAAGVVSGAFLDGAIVTLGNKADARSTATDSTPVSVMQVLKEISFALQNPAPVTETNAANGTTGAAVPATAIYIGINVGGNLTGWGGAVTAISGGYADGAISTIGSRADTAWVSGSGSVVSLLKNIATGVGSSIPAGTNTIGTVNVAAATTGGCTPGVTISAASTNATNVKASAGTLCKLVVVNSNSVLAYLKMYDGVAAPSCSSSTVVASYVIPFGSSNSGGGVAIPLGPFGEAYSSGIAFCLTGGIANNDATNSVTGITISYSYK